MTRSGVTRPHPTAAQEVALLPPLSSIRPFRRFWTALTLSGLGTWLSVPALTAMAGVLARDQDTAARAQAIGGVLVLMVLPALLLAPPAGMLAARLDRRITLIVADVLRFALVVSVPFVDAQAWTLAAAFLVATLSLLWIPVARGSVPVLVPDDRRVEARRSALRAACGTAPVAALLFAVLALIANGTFGAGSRADLPLYVTAAVFLASAAAVALPGELPGAPAPVPSPLKLIVRGPGTAPEAGRGISLAVAAASSAAGAVIAVARVHAGELGGGDAGYGAVLTGLTVGLAFGLFLGPRILGPFSRRRLLGLAVITQALALVVISLVLNLVVVAFVTAFLGVAAGAAWSTAAAALVPGDTEAEAAEAAETADGDRPRAYLHSVALVAVLVAFAGVPPLAGVLGSHRVEVGDSDYDYDGTGLALLIVAVLALLGGVVAFRRLDDRRGIPLLPDIAAALQGRVYTPPELAGTPAEPAVRRERGVFIAFEGGEGAGKTTQARLAAIYLRDHGYDVVTTHEPGATKIGMRLRAMLLDRETTGLSSRAETLLYAADRADHVANVIRPAMARGAIVVSDRYVDSSLAYQGYGRQQPVDEIAGINVWATGGLIPDLTVLLELPVEEGLRRLPAPADRIEAESRDFHERVRAGFRARAEAEPGRYLILDASRPQAELSREIQYRIREILPDPIPVGTEDITSTFPAITD